MKGSTKKIFDQIAELSRKDHLIIELADALEGWHSNRAPANEMALLQEVREVSRNE